MGGFLGIGGKKPKTSKIPPLPEPPPPPPPPEPLPTVSQETGEEQIKKARRRSGYAKTILTGSLVPETTGKKTVLG